MSRHTGVTVLGSPESLHHGCAVGVRSSGRVRLAWVAKGLKGLVSSKTLVFTQSRVKV